MTVLDAQRSHKRATHALAPQVGSGTCLQPPTPHAPGLFSPTRPTRWVALTTLAVLATATVGVGLPWAIDPLIEAALAPLRGSAMMPWVRPSLWAGYVLFVTLVVLPFLVFLAWSWTGGPRPGRPSLSGGRWSRS